MNHQKKTYKPLIAEKRPIPKALPKNHSKSLYYYNSLNRNLKPNLLSAINKTSLNASFKDPNHQTLNEELLGIEKPKPQTSHFNSGRINHLENNLRSNKISLRTSSNYNHLNSVAGVTIN